MKNKKYFAFLFLAIFTTPWCIRMHERFFYVYHYVAPWSGVHFKETRLVQFINAQTPIQSLFLVPPNFENGIRARARRSVVVDYMSMGTEENMYEWKRRMDEVTGVDIFLYSRDELDNLYFSLPINKIKKVIGEYDVDYLLTLNTIEQKGKYPNEEFVLVYEDTDFLLFKIR